MRTATPLRACMRLFCSTLDGTSQTMAERTYMQPIGDMISIAGLRYDAGFAVPVVMS